jgi:hypothetical protein
MALYSVGAHCAVETLLIPELRESSLNSLTNSSVGRLAFLRYVDWTVGCDEPLKVGGWFCQLDLAHLRYSDLAHPPGNNLYDLMMPVIALGRSALYERGGILQTQGAPYLPLLPRLRERARAGGLSREDFETAVTIGGAVTTGGP